MMTSETNGLASAEQLFSGGLKRRYKTVDLPVSEHKVRIRSLSENEVSEYQSVTVASGGTGLRRDRLRDANRRLIVLCLVDQAGNRILGKSHIAKLGEWDGADTAFLYDECVNHCGLNREDIEDLVKNSETTTVDDSPAA